MAPRVHDHPPSKNRDVSSKDSHLSFGPPDPLTAGVPRHIVLLQGPSPQKVCERSLRHPTRALQDLVLITDMAAQEIVRIDPVEGSEKRYHY